MLFVPTVKKKTAKVYRSELGEFLDQRFLAWRRNTPGERGTFVEWADAIKVVREKLNNYIYRGTIPRDKGLDELAAIFGEEVYLMAGKLPPDERLHLVFRLWGKLPDDVKTEIAEIVARATARTTQAERTGIRVEETQRR